MAVGRRAAIWLLLIDSPAGDQTDDTVVPSDVKTLCRILAPVCALQRQPEQSHDMTSGQAARQLAECWPSASTGQAATQEASRERPSHSGSRPDALKSAPNLVLSR